MSVLHRALTSALFSTGALFCSVLVGAAVPDGASESTVEPAMPLSAISRLRTYSGPKFRQYVGTVEASDLRLSPQEVTLTCKLPPTLKHPDGLIGSRTVKVNGDNRNNYHMNIMGPFTASRNFGYLKSIKDGKPAGTWFSCSYDVVNGTASVVLEHRQVAGLVETDEYFVLLNAASGDLAGRESEINRELVRLMDRLHTNHIMMSHCSSQLSSNFRAGPDSSSTATVNRANDKSESQNLSEVEACSPITKDVFLKGQLPIENLLTAVSYLQDRNRECESVIRVCQHAVSALRR